MNHTFTQVLNKLQLALDTNTDVFKKCQFLNCFHLIESHCNLKKIRSDLWITGHMYRMNILSVNSVPNLTKCLSLLQQKIVHVHNQVQICNLTYI